MLSKKSPNIRLLAAAIILTSCIGCDQATKSIATQTLRNAPPVDYLNGTIRMEYALNPGGFLSLGRNLPERIRPWVFIGFNSALMLGLGLFLLWNSKLPFSIYTAALFILGGGIGNLIDRVSNQGLVTDFINLGIGRLRTGIFNVADIAVSCGAVAFIWLSHRQDHFTQSQSRDAANELASH